MQESGITTTSQSSICAVIITYHPTVRMIENITKTLAQVNALVVIDNGSTSEEIGRLRNAGCLNGFHLIENQENLGIAEALNQGVLWAKNEGFPWVILFDQDSKITNGFVEQMFTDWQAHPMSDQVVSVHPCYIEPNTGIEAKVYRAKDGGPVASMTSGALMPTWIFDKIGLFPSEYFIDQVDTEYSYRIRAAGYLIADSRKAILMHGAGHQKRVTVLGFSFQPTYHNATRRYYLTRNRIAAYRKYFPIFPRWILHAAYFSLRETIKCFIAEPKRLQKFRSLLLGIWDGLRGKMGKREGV